MTDGATTESVQGFDAKLYEPDAIGATEHAPGWSDEETFESFESFTAAMGNSGSRLGAAK
jgi:hypothetical protein